MEDWKDIVMEEIQKMIDSIKERGVHSLKVDIKVEKMEDFPLPSIKRKTELKDIEGGIQEFDIDDIDEIFKNIPSKHKCICCGKISRECFKNETGEYVCKECNKSLDVYRKKIKDILNYNEKENKAPVLECLQAIIDFYEDNMEKQKEIENEEEGWHEEFINKYLKKFLKGKDLKNIDDIVDFLDEVILDIENGNMEL